MRKIVYTIIGMVALAGLFLLFTKDNRGEVIGDNGKENDEFTTITIADGGNVVVPKIVESVVRDGWDLYGVATSKHDDRYFFSTIKFLKVNAAQSRLYITSQDNRSLYLLFETGTSSYYWRPSLWRADDKIVVDEVGVDMDHPYNELLVDLQGKPQTKPVFMRLFNVWDSNNQYFLTPISSGKAQNINTFPWAPQKAFDQLIWEDVLSANKMVVESNDKKHYTALGISNEGDSVLFYEYEVKNSLATNPTLYLKNIRTGEKVTIEYESRDDINNYLRTLAPSTSFNIFWGFVVDK